MGADTLRVDDARRSVPTPNSILFSALILAMLVWVSGCSGGGSDGDSAGADTGGEPGPPPTTGSNYFDGRLPPGFPEPNPGDDLVMSEAKVDLGRHLFYDRRISINETLSCASCHQPALAFTDGLQQSIGALGDRHPRNAMSLANSVYNATQNWANPNTVTLHQQALGPMFNESPIIELGWTNNEATILDRFRVDPDYPERFARAFPDTPDPIQADQVAEAVAAFSASLISGNSEYDELVYQGGSDTVSDAVIRGYGMFFSEQLECFHCHGGFNFASSVEHVGLAFNQAQFHNNGMYNVGGRGSYPTGNQGLYDLTGNPDDRGKFKAPTLRNIEITAPYMHDGSVATLEEVIDIYARGGRLISEGPNAGDGANSPLLSPLLNGFTISEAEKADLLAFLKSLTDWPFICDERHSDPFGELPEHERCAALDDED